MKFRGSAVKGKTRLATNAFLAVATSVFLIAALTATGFPVRHVAANDGGIWLTNNTQASFGRFVYPIGQLNAAFGTAGGFEKTYNLDILQQGTTVLAEDKGRSDLYSVDVQNGSLSLPGVNIPGGSSSLVALGGSNAAILNPNNGDLWMAEVATPTGSTLANLKTNAKATAVIKDARALTVGLDGTVYVASPTQLYTFKFGNGLAQKPIVTSINASLSNEITLTAVGSTPVIYDATHQIVALPLAGKTVSIPGSSTAILQQPGPNSNSVLLATNSSLFSIPLIGGSSKVLGQGGNGTPAAPVFLDQCANSAWSGAPGIYLRACSGQPAARYSLSGPGLSSPIFRVNNDQIILNDMANGEGWLLSGKTTVALNSGDWQKLIASNDQVNSAKLNSSTLSSGSNQKPKVLNQHLEARLGRATILHILDGASDPYGSALSISNVSPTQGLGYSIQVAPDGQTVSVTLDLGLTNPVNFNYTVIDARGLTASGTVTVTPTTSETAPYQLPATTSTTRHIASSATASYQVLGNWRDKEGDPIAISSASATAGTVTWTSDGLITYTAPTFTSDTPVAVTYIVTDGTDQASGVLNLVVLGRGDTNMYPPVASPDVVHLIVGQTASMSPLSNDLPGADPIHPNAVLALSGPIAPVAGLSVATNVSTSRVQLTAAQSGVYSLTYQDSFGSAPVDSSQILVVANAPSAAANLPVTTPSSVLLHGQYPSTVNVLANDYDPTGGLLTITGATSPAGVSATVVNGSLLRVQATVGSLAGQSLVFYTVTNGISSPVQGQLSVTWAPALPPTPPVANPINSVVRAGDAVNIPVLDNVVDPGGAPVYVVPNKVKITSIGGVTNQSNLGSASVAGNILRYAAPPSSLVRSVETLNIAYEVQDQNGEQTTGNVTMTVNPVDAATDSAPTPKSVNVRIAAGGTLTIPIHTTGVDPNGDSVSVTGVVVPPKLGRILSFTSSSIVYQAYPLSSGTDSFSYQVEDRFGLAGTAVVRVAVVPPGTVAPPVAVPVFITAAPGENVLVNVLANDIVSNGDHVTIEPLSATNTHIPKGVSLSSNVILATVPSAGSPPLVVNYGITDGSASPSVASLTIRSQPGFVTPPIAVDDVASQPAKGQTFTIVHVLANDYNPVTPSGPLKIVRVFDSNVKIVGNTLKIPVHQFAYSVPYEIANQAGGTAVGVVHVPGLAAVATLKPNVSSIQVPLNGSVDLNINNYVADAIGPLHLVSNSSVFVSPAAGLSWHPSSYSSLVLSDSGKYVGPGEISFDVALASSNSKTVSNSMLVNLPVQVGPPTPVLRCPTTPLTLVQGGAPVNLTIDTACQVWTSSPSQQSTLSFAASWSKPPQGVNLSLANSNSQLVLSASGSANPGETGIVNVSIPGTSASSKLLVEVLPAPLPTIAAVNIPSAKAGTAISIDMSQFVSSPIPNAQIKVTALHQNGASNATVSFAGSVVNITPAVGVNGVLTFSVSVTDEASQAASRTVTGVITVQVLDVPGAPGPIQGVPGNQQVALSWTAAPSNGAPIDYYQVSVNGGSAVNVPGTSYVWTGLTNGTQYQFTVRAHNSVGLSTAQSTAFFAPQSVPGPPGAVSAVPGNGEVALSWGASNPNGQPVSYLVSVSPAPSSGQSSVNVSSTSYTWSGLNNNVGPYIFTVTPLNKVGSGTPAQSSAVYAFGVPPTPSAPSASGSVSPDQSTTTVTVSWPVSPLCNDARPCASYIVTELKNGVPFQTVGPSSPTCSSGNGDCVSFGPIVNDGSSYTYELQQINRENQTSPISAASTPPIQAVGVPAAVTNLAVSPGNHSLNVTFSIPASHGSLVSLVKYTATNGSGGASVAGSWANPGATGSTISETIGGLSNGDTYTISVQACNELGECAPSSNTVSSFPYGPPFAPTVNDTSSGNVITYTWSGGGGNGRPVSAYYVCIDGSCANEGSQVGSKSITYSLSTCGTPHSVYAYVLDNASPPEQSPNSSTATAATAACAPPTPPSVSTSLSGNTVTYAWSGGGGNGQTISYYQLCVDGNCSNVGSAPGQTQVNYPCGVNAVTHSAYGTVVMAATQYQVAQTSSPSPTASVSIAACPPPTPPTVTASANGDTITYTWAGGNGNGLPISYYVLCVDGSCSNVGAAPGQEQVTYPCGQTHSAYGQIVVANSVTSANSSTVSATTAACAPPSLSISFNSGTSGYTTFAWSNFPSGYNTFTCYFKVAPTVGGPYSYSFAAGSGSVSSGTCYSFTSGDTIQVVVSGPGLPNVTSNTLSVQ